MQPRQKKTTLNSEQTRESLKTLQTTMSSWHEDPREPSSFVNAERNHPGKLFGGCACGIRNPTRIWLSWWAHQNHFANATRINGVICDINRQTRRILIFCQPLANMLRMRPSLVSKACREKKFNETPESYGLWDQMVVRAEPHVNLEPLLKTSVLSMTNSRYLMKNLWRSVRQTC